MVFSTTEYTEYTEMANQEFLELDDALKAKLTDLSICCFVEAQKRGWHESDEVDVPKALYLIHSEVSEALESYRDRDMNMWLRDSDGKPEGFPSELADIVIRVFDLAGLMNIDIGNAIVEKMKFNQTRPYRHGGKVC